MSEMVGRTIADRYRVDAFVGRGGMADVYKVWDSQRLAYLALKQLHADLAEDIAFLRRFRREARTLEALAHPNIVRFYGLEQVDGLAFMMMDYVEGVHLRKAIFENHAALPLEQALGIMRPVTAALHYAHGQGIAHCDMKPANVMIKQNGDVFVADFGIARLAESATTTMAGAGTPAYMAPEQCRAEAVDGRTDIYALGIVLYEMVTGGERPFVGEHATGTGSTSEKVRWEQLNAPPPSPREFNPALPPAVEQVIFKCLEKDPRSRYQSTPDLWNALVTATANIHGDTYSVPTIKVPPLGSTLPPLVTPTPTPPSHYTPPPPVFAPPPAPAATVLESAPVAAAAPRRSLTGLWITLALIAVIAIGGLIAMQVGGFGLALFKPADTPTPTVTPTLTPTPSPTFEPPAVQLLSPTGGQVNLVLGQEPLVVQVVAMAGAGVARVDFNVNGALKDARQGDGMDKSMATQFEWTPPDEGAYLISVEVLGRDGSTSEMTAFSVIVSRPTPTPTPRPSNTPAPTATATARGSTGGGGTSGGSIGGTSTGARSVDGTFTSSAANVSAGQQVTISWDLKANQAFIFSAELWERASGPAGFHKYTLDTNVKQSSGSRAFAPTSTTTYELHIFYNDKSEQAAQQTKTVTVTVGGVGAIAPAATTAPATGGGGGSPITIRRVSFVSGQRIGTGNDGNLTLSVEFTGGAGPFTISGDGVTTVTKGITGTYTDAGITYSYVHFVKVASCGGNFAATVKVTDAAGQTASFPYYIGTVTCP